MLRFRPNGRGDGSSTNLRSSGFATEDRVVDDSFVTFEVIRDGYRRFPVGFKIEMRLVHICEMRDGKISRELVFDMGRRRS